MIHHELLLFLSLSPFNVICLIYVGIFRLDHWGLLKGWSTLKHSLYAIRNQIVKPMRGSILITFYYHRVVMINIIFIWVMFMCFKVVGIWYKVHMKLFICLSHSIIVNWQVHFRRHKKEIATLKQELALKDALNGRPGISYDDLT